MARGVWGGGGGWGDYSREAINRGTAIIQGGTYELPDVDSQFQNKIVLSQVSDCVSSWINGVTLPTDLFGAFIFS